MKLALIAVLALAIAVSASYPRLTVLGGDARLMISDYTEMWAYPGTISGYQFVTGESDNAGNTDGWFGMVRDFDGTTFGATINHGDMLEVLVHPGNWGLIVGIDYEKATVEMPDTTFATQKTTGFDAAWGTDMSMFGDYSDFAIGFGYDKYSTTIADVDAGGTSDISAGASVRGHQDAFFNLFPIISAGLDMYEEDDGDDATANEKETSIMFDLGAGYNHMIAPKTCLVMGAFGGVESVSFSGELGDLADGQMYITIPRITGGVEQMIGKFFVLRAGATSETQYYSSGDYNSFLTDFNTNFGIGLKWDNFTMDATIGEDFLHAGPYVVGGESNGFLGQLAATYTF
jgi:hypothetical protein